MNFSAVNFGGRMSVLKTAMTFEELGASAHSGGGAAIQNPKYLAAAGSIVSVEARHAATIRDMLRPFTKAFAGDDMITRGGFDVANPASAVLRAAAPFIATPVAASQLP
jgi:glyoxylate carboligase